MISEEIVNSLCVNLIYLVIYPIHELNNWYTESTMRYRPVFNKEAITRKGIDNMLYHPDKILIQMEKNGPH